MRKLKLQMQMSLDGFVSTGPNDEQRWVTHAWSQIRPHVLSLFDSCDTILLGRKLAEDYIPYWNDVYLKPDNLMHEVAERIVNAKKVVFTKTLQQSKWSNTEIASGSITEEINRLKGQSGKDIIVYGGSSFVASLVGADVIDEYHFFINPVVLGHGDSVFGRLESFKRLNLIKSQIYDSGIALMIFESTPFKK